MFELVASICTADFIYFLQAIATTEVVSRRSGHPCEHQVLRRASQLVSNMAHGRGRTVGNKAAGLSASSETRNTRRQFLAKPSTFPCRATLHVLFDMTMSLVWTKLSQWPPYLQASSHTGPSCPDTERHPRSGISRCSSCSAPVCTPSCPKSHGTARTAEPGSHYCVFQQCSSFREPGP